MKEISSSFQHFSCLEKLERDLSFFSFQHSLSLLHDSSNVTLVQSRDRNTGYACVRVRDI